MTRYDAFRALLALPDPPELHRGRVYVCAGDPWRRDRLKLELERAYLRWRQQEAGREPGEIVSVRRGVRKWRQTA